MTNYAKTESKMVWLKYDFGNELARKWFGDDAIDALPQITRGKNKGKPKGVLVWTKCTHGGWVKTGAYNHDIGQATGYVMPQGCHNQEIKEYGYSDAVWLRTDDLLKNRAKRDAADDKIRAEIQEKIDYAQKKIDSAEASIREIEAENYPNASKLKTYVSNEAERAKVIIEIATEDLEYLKTKYNRV